MNKLELWALSALSLGAVAAAQEAPATTNRPVSLPPGSPVSASTDLPVSLLAPTATPQNFNRDMGAPQSVPVAFDDEVPAAGEALIETGAHGDTLVSRASGNPYFLGFAGGNYFPSADERLDPELVAQASLAQANGRAETFGFVMFGKRMTQARVEALKALGVRVLEFHPHYCLKVALPTTQLDNIAALDFVRWLGVARPAQKIHPRVATLTPGDDGRLALYVDVFESDLGPQSTKEPVATAMRADNGTVSPAGDIGALPSRVHSNGRAHKALTALGVEVIEYVETIKAFRVRCVPQQVEALVAQDFVQFVEADLEKKLTHDESTPMIGTDFSRAYYSGNSSGQVTIGQADSGVDASHWALGIAAWGWDFTGLGNPFADGCEHGSHVMGTILGNGSGSFSASLKGVSPGLARGDGTSRAYISRIFNNSCGWGGPALATLFSVNQGSYWDGYAYSIKPQLVSNSWGSSGIGWIGSEADARTIDNEVFNQDQLYLFAAGNDGSGSSTILLEATAKNALSIGAVVDYYAPSGFPGAVADFSSRGPCGDGRWKPNVVAPGTSIRSVDANSTTGYRDLSGTSMATPHVAGLAAQITDAMSWLRYQPEGIAAVLMSSAETKANALLTLPSDSHLRNYGTGRVQAQKAIFGSSDYYWNTWVFDAPWYASPLGDFTVPANTSRITVCMNYYEPASSAGDGQALVNNWDLYIDDPINGIDPAQNGGDWVAQQSTLDNCEIRSLNNPTPGVWRWKSFPQAATLFSNVKMSVCVTFEINSATCNPTYDVYGYTNYAQPNQAVDIYAQVNNYNGLASGVSLDEYDSGATILQSEGSLYDGSTTDHTTNQSGGRDVELGDIAPYYGRSQRWRVSWPTEGNHYLGAYMDIDNYGYVYDSVSVIVDATPPSSVVLNSSSHTSMVWSNDTTIDMFWSTPADNLSGVAGYSFATFAGGIPLDPGNSMNIGNVNSATFGVLSSSSAIYVCARPVDNCGNWTTGYSWAAPYLVDAVAPGAPGGLQSSTHSAGLQSCSTNVTAVWATSVDSHSGLAGYAGVWDTSPSTVPSGALNIGAGATSYAVNIGSSASARYFHLRAKDNASNWGTTAHFGPVYANASSVATYCTGKTNSLGCVPFITFANQPDKSAGTFTVNCNSVLNQQNGLIIWGHAAIAVPFQGGTLCVGSPLVRGPLIGSGGAGSGSSCTGAYSHVFTTAYMNAWGINPGNTLFAQFWMRDPPIASTTGLSNALQFTVCE